MDETKEKNSKNPFMNLRFFNWKLWLSLCALALVPAIYQTIRTFILSSSTSLDGIDIVSHQMEWYDLIDETIKAFLIIPLYSILNKFFSKDKDNFKYVVFKTMLIVLVLYVSFNVAVFIYGRHLIGFMNPNTNDIKAIEMYLALETIAFTIGIIPNFVNVVFVTVGKARNVYVFLLVQTIFGIISDFLFVPQVGVNGMAISNMITNTVLGIASIVILLFEGYIKVSWLKKSDTLLIKEWLKTGFFSGSQQLIDNLIYSLMVVRMVNVVLEQGNYWVANNFIWGWLLIPVSALSEVIKRDCQNEYKELRQSNYYIISIFVFVLWASTLPLWIPFFKYVEKLENYHEIFLIAVKLVPFYVAYTLSIIPDSIFIGYGKTHYNAINSLLVNFVYYGVWFGLYLSSSVTFSMTTIIMIFGFGMVFHEVVSIIENEIFKKWLNIGIIKKPL